MDSFELGRLTDHEFEEVCRDLFSDLLGVPLEIFPRGRDRGIDLRNTAADGSRTIVQCKHRPGSTSAQLVAHLIKEELPKVTGLKPARYVIATSTAVTVDGKEKLVTSFAPYVRTTGDIHGVGEIVAALRSRPELVERHFRLWLSSTAVLQTLLNKAQHQRSALLRRRLPDVAATFVAHDGFERARVTLSAQHVCVLAGIPGVGKTTVALMLAAWLMGKGYEVYEVSQDIDEINDLWREDVPQVFLYDDFLGQTTLENVLNKNEDSRLLTVIRAIEEAPDKALVMTSRDYILEHAAQRYERLADPDVSDATAVIRLTDLSLSVRGQILYNHVDRSAVPTDQKRRFAEPEVWRPIVEHRNFNPRLIEETLRLAKRQEGDVGEAMLENLNAPRKIWERIVENQLTEEAVQILEVLFTLQSATLAELEESWSWYRQELDKGVEPRTFRSALRVVEGTMLTIDGDEISFHNPSIADYLRYHLNEGRAHIQALLGAMVDLRQLRELVGAANMADGANIRTQLMECASTVLAALHDVEDGDAYFGTSLSDLLDNLEWLLDLGDLLESQPITNYATSQLEYIGVYLDHEGQLVRFAQRLRSYQHVPMEVADQFEEKAAAAIRDELETQIEAQHWAAAFAAYEALRELSRETLDGDLWTGLIECGLVWVRELSRSDPDEWHIETVESLLEFLFENDAQYDQEKEYATVESALEGLIEARKAQPHRRPLAEEERFFLRDPDASRDLSRVAELMERLADPELPVSADGIPPSHPTA
ncbi:restriction endonuclease [Kitasatospora sp. NBC_00085]|uniref:nSTAND3 domain-containing NTPase n=1 Tax=Kitasatospora sp. NBC_00085 TaxID=2903566 RepID=UPI00324E42C4